MELRFIFKTNPDMSVGIKGMAVRNEINIRMDILITSGYIM